MRYIFIHGGPGLNSNPESQLLVKDFTSRDHEILFWNEPSCQRDKNFTTVNAYSRWLESLSSYIQDHSKDEKVALIAHSFGAFAVNDLLPSLGERIAELCLVAPLSDALRLDENIMSLARKSDSKLDVAFTQERFDALMGALSDPKVLPSYWYNKGEAELYNQCFNGQFAPDFSSFEAVRKSVPHNTIRHTFKSKVTAIYGDKDPVVKLSQDRELLMRLYPQCRTHLSQNSAHYPHIEEKNEFLSQLFI